MDRKTKQFEAYKGRDAKQTIDSLLLKKTEDYMEE